MIDLNRVAPSPRRVATIDQGPLRRRPHLTVGTVQRGEKQHSAVETLGVANRGNGDINRRAGAGKRRKRGRDENRGDVFDHHRRGRELNSHLLQEIGQGLNRKHRLLAVAGALEARHHSVANQQVVAHALHRGHVTQANLARLRFLARQPGRKQEHLQPENANP